MCRFWFPILWHIHGMPRMCYRHPNGMRSLLKCLGSNGQFQNVLCNSEGFTYEVIPCFWECPNLSMNVQICPGKMIVSQRSYLHRQNTRDFTWFHHHNIKLKGRWPGTTWAVNSKGDLANQMVVLGARRVGDLFITRPPWFVWELVIGGVRAGVPLGSRTPMHLFTYIHMYYIYIVYVTTSTKIDSRKNLQGSRSLCHFLGVH